MINLTKNMFSKGCGNVQTTICSSYTIVTIPSPIPPPPPPPTLTSMNSNLSGMNNSRLRRTTPIPRNTKNRMTNKPRTTSGNTAPIPRNTKNRMTNKPRTTSGNTDTSRRNSRLLSSTQNSRMSRLSELLQKHRKYKTNKSRRSSTRDGINKSELDKLRILEIRKMRMKSRR